MLTPTFCNLFNHSSLQSRGLYFIFTVLNLNKDKIKTILNEFQFYNVLRKIIPINIPKNIPSYK